MHRVEALISGVRGAENGTVSAVIRGTATPATYYTDFEGTSSGTATALSLDQYGGRVLFFDRLVTITAYSSGGAVVRTWTAGDDAGAVELKSASFTGTPYAGGGAVAGGPTTVEAAMDLWITSAGATNFQALVGGVATNLSTVLGSIAGLRYFVVTDAAYGAVGDGVNDDTAEINAAIAAANAAGGGVVFFPKGTYRITSALTCYATVALVGVSRTLAIITSTAGLVSGVAPYLISNLSVIGASGSVTVNWTSSANSASLMIDNCTLYTGTTGVIGAASLGSDVTLRIRDTDFAGYSAAFASTFTVAGVSEFSVSGCRMTTTSVAASFTAITGNWLFNTVTNCKIDLSAATSAAVVAFAGSGIAIGNLVYPQSVTTSYTVVSGVWSDHGNEFYNPVTHSTTSRLYNYAWAGGESVDLGARRKNYIAPVNSNADPIAIPSLQNETVMVRVTSTAAHAGNVGVNMEVAPQGCTCVLQIWNDTAGPITFEWGTGVSIAGGTTFAVAANSVRTFILKSNYINAALEWFLVAATGGAEVAE